MAEVSVQVLKIKIDIFMGGREDNIIFDINNNFIKRKSIMKWRKLVSITVLMDKKYNYMDDG